MILQIKNVKKQYGDKTVLDIENLKIEKGKKYALLGANGSGKTTLLKILARVEKDYSGDIEIDKTKIGYMPQKSFGFSLSVLNNMMLACPLNDRKASKEKALSMLDLLKLTHLKKKNASKLSGGETQRLALGRLITTPFELLLLDEPTASMDIDSTATTEQVLGNYIKENNTTLIFATHSFNQAQRFADEIIFLVDGKVVEQGSAKHALSTPNTSELKEFLKKA